MKAQLILLENPIIVTDEVTEPEMFTYYYDLSKNKIEFEGDSDAIDLDPNWRKIIGSNISKHEAKQIDYNGIDFGIVDVEWLALKRFPFGVNWSDEANEINGDRILGFKEGFKASQQLNENKFTLEEISTYFIGGNKKGSFFDDYLDYRLETNDKISFKEWFIKANAVIPPKTFDIEIEETPTNIKIIKKL